MHMSHASELTSVMYRLSMFNPEDLIAQLLKILHTLLLHDATHLTAVNHSHRELIAIAMCDICHTVRSTGCAGMSAAGMSAAGMQHFVRFKSALLQMLFVEPPW